MSAAPSGSDDAGASSCALPSASQPPPPPPRVLVENPGGELELGTDFARVKDVAAAPPRAAAHDGGGASDDDADERARERDAARALSVQYQHSTLRTRRRVFFALLALDFMFFASALVYTLVRSPGSLDANRRFGGSNSSNGGGVAAPPDTSSSTVPGDLTAPPAPAASPPPSNGGGGGGGGGGFLGGGSIPVTWWLPMDSLKLEDIVFSIVLDFLGVLGALHGRSTILSLFILLEALCTALITLAGLSLLQVFRLALLGAAFYLRAAVITLAVLHDAAGLGPPAPPPRAPGMRGALDAHVVRPFASAMAALQRWPSPPPPPPDAAAAAAPPSAEQQPPPPADALALTLAPHGTLVGGGSGAFLPGVPPAAVAASPPAQRQLGEIAESARAAQALLLRNSGGGAGGAPPTTRSTAAGPSGRGAGDGFSSSSSNSAAAPVRGDAAV